MTQKTGDVTQKGEVESGHEWNRTDPLVCVDVGVCAGMPPMGQTAPLFFLLFFDFTVTGVRTETEKNKNKKTKRDLPV